LRDRETHDTFDEPPYAPDLTLHPAALLTPALLLRLRVHHHHELSSSAQQATLVGYFIYYPAVRPSTSPEPAVPPTAGEPFFRQTPSPDAPASHHLATYMQEQGPRLNLRTLTFLSANTRYTG
jgi:hypothetical protein